MAKYLLIETRDPFETASATWVHPLALTLAIQHHEVIVFFVENGVFAARARAITALLEDLHAVGVELLADEFSLRERGIDISHRSRRVASADLDVVLHALADGRTTLWH